MTDTSLTLADGHQYLHPDRVADGFHQIADFFVRVFLFEHIPKTEYII
jgi:hypothetical protein